MIDEIKKEIKKTFYIDENDMHFEKANINIDSLFEILDKYKDKEIKFENGSSKYAIVKVPELKFQDIKELNDEVEIIEEDKQIKKFEINYARDIEEKIFYEESDKPNHCILRDAGTELLINKINELIENQNKIIRELKANKKP